MNSLNCIKFALDKKTTKQKIKENEYNLFEENIISKRKIRIYDIIQTMKSNINFQNLEIFLLLNSMAIHLYSSIKNS